MPTCLCGVPCNITDPDLKDGRSWHLCEGCLKERNHVECLGREDHIRGGRYTCPGCSKTYQLGLFWRYYVKQLAISPSNRAASSSYLLECLNLICPENSTHKRQRVQKMRAFNWVAEFGAQDLDKQPAAKSLADAGASGQNGAEELVDLAAAAETPTERLPGDTMVTTSAAGSTATVMYPGMPAELRGLGAEEFLPSTAAEILSELIQEVVGDEYVAYCTKCNAKKRNNKDLVLVCCEGHWNCDTVLCLRCAGLSSLPTKEWKCSGCTTAEGAGPVHLTPARSNNALPSEPSAPATTAPAKAQPSTTASSTSSKKGSDKPSHGSAANSESVAAPASKPGLASNPTVWHADSQLVISTASTKLPLLCLPAAAAPLLKNAPAAALIAFSADMAHAVEAFLTKLANPTAIASTKPSAAVSAAAAPTITPVSPPNMLESAFVDAVVSMRNEQHDKADSSTTTAAASASHARANTNAAAAMMRGMVRPIGTTLPLESLPTAATYTVNGLPIHELSYEATEKVRAMMQAVFAARAAVASNNFTIEKGAPTASVEPEDTPMQGAQASSKQSAGNKRARASPLATATSTTSQTAGSKRPKAALSKQHEVPVAKRPRADSGDLQAETSAFTAEENGFGAPGRQAGRQTSAPTPSSASVVAKPATVATTSQQQSNNIAGTPNALPSKGGPTIQPATTSAATTATVAANPSGSTVNTSTAGTQSSTAVSNQASTTNAHTAASATVTPQSTVVAKDTAPAAPPASNKPAASAASDARVSVPAAGKAATAAVTAPHITTDSPARLSSNALPATKPTAAASPHSGPLSSLIMPRLPAPLEKEAPAEPVPAVTAPPPKAVEAPTTTAPEASIPAPHVHRPRMRLVFGSRPTGIKSSALNESQMTILNTRPPKPSSSPAPPANVVVVIQQDDTAKTTSRVVTMQPSSEPPRSSVSSPAARLQSSVGNPDRGDAAHAPPSVERTQARAPGPLGTSSAAPTSQRTPAPSQPSSTAQGAPSRAQQMLSQLMSDVPTYGTPSRTPPASIAAPIPSSRAPLASTSTTQASAASTAAKQVSFSDAPRSITSSLPYTTAPAASTAPAQSAPSRFATLSTTLPASGSGTTSTAANPVQAPRITSASTATKAASTPDRATKPVQPTPPVASAPKPVHSPPVPSPVVASSPFGVPPAEAKLSKLLSALQAAYQPSTSQAVAQLATAVTPAPKPATTSAAPAYKPITPQSGGSANSKTAAVTSGRAGLQSFAPSAPNSVPVVTKLVSTASRAPAPAPSTAPAPSPAAAPSPAPAPAVTPAAASSRAPSPDSTQTSQVTASIKDSVQKQAQPAAPSVTAPTTTTTSAPVTTAAPPVKPIPPATANGSTPHAVATAVAASKAPADSSAPHAGAKQETPESVRRYAEYLRLEKEAMEVAGAPIKGSNGVDASATQVTTSQSSQRFEPFVLKPQQTSSPIAVHDVDSGNRSASEDIVITSMPRDSAPSSPASTHPGPIKPRQIHHTVYTVDSESDMETSQ